MSEEKSRIIFSNNLKRLLELNQKQPADIVRDLGIPFSTVSNCYGKLGDNGFRVVP